jgi:hypothetical protein
MWFGVEKILRRMTFQSFVEIRVTRKIAESVLFPDNCCETHALWWRLCLIFTHNFAPNKRTSFSQTTFTSWNTDWVNSCTTPFCGLTSFIILRKNRKKFFIQSSSHLLYIMWNETLVRGTFIMKLSPLVSGYSKSSEFFLWHFWL